MTKTLLIILLVFVVAAVAFPFVHPGNPLHDEFNAFKEKFSKSYATPEEHNRRFLIFVDNLRNIKELNNKNDGATYGVTQFTDLTKEEFKAKFLMTNPGPLGPKEPVAPLMINDTKASLPASFTWLDHNPPVVTHVYNQQQCGSCWAFSATENIESRWALAGHPLVSLAMQQIVDCDTTDYGCAGGWPYNAYKYVMAAGGMDPLRDYPYVAVDETCKFKRSEVAAKIKGWEYVTNNQNEEQMRSYLVANGPLSVCVDASNWSLYTGGVYPASNCGTSIDHCVDIVGYDVSAGYWIIRNSWGTSWGLDGFMHLQYGADACAVAQVVTSSIAA